MRGVIEHLANPEKEVGTISKTIKSNGVLFISATPDFNSACAASYKGEWQHLTFPVHYHQFTIASLAILMSKFSLSLEAVEYPYTITPYASPKEDFEKYKQNNLRKAKKQVSKIRHAYPGNMLSAVFRKY